MSKSSPKDHVLSINFNMRQLDASMQSKIQTVGEAEMTRRAEMHRRHGFRQTEQEERFASFPYADAREGPTHTNGAFPVVADSGPLTIDH
jgi:hypothetical protein